MLTAASVTDPKVLYKAVGGRVDVIDVGDLQFASVDGRGAPADAAFAQAVRGLYTVAYGVRFALRRQGVDEKVSPLEAVWSMPDAPAAFRQGIGAGSLRRVREAWVVLARHDPPSVGGGRGRGRDCQT